MTQENKELLLRDLCSRLPYDVKCKIEMWIGYDVCTIYNINSIGYVEIVEDSDTNGVSVERVKPYLFPLSSMTDELWDKEFRGFREYGITEFTRDSFKYGCETLEFNNSNPDLSSMVRFINQLIKNHFDIYGLIPMGLAIDATGLNIY